ncbi:MAG TPA: YafY family protein [Chitinophagaceae bacterium]|nr:YafY family protein [Chitinophagaceae bacterium]
MNRIDRIAAILIQLQSKRLVKGNEIAKRFDISLRTVYRDIKTLEEAGVPILSEAGSGYSIMEGYRLPPVMFTREEALTFLTAEKLIDQFTDQSTHQIFQSALYKIKAVLRSDEKDHLDEMNQVIQVKPISQTTPHETHNHLQSILEAIANKAVLEIDYFANHTQQKSFRQIEPIGVFLSSNRWHLIAYCQLRSDYRNFRLDRIQSLKNTSRIFETIHPSFNTFLQKVIHEDRDLHEVLMKVDKSALKYFGEQKYYNGYIGSKEVDDRVEMTFLTASLEGFARWFMMFGDNAEIVKPQELKRKIQQIAEDLIKKIK